MKKLFLLLLIFNLFACSTKKRDQYFYYFSNSTNEKIEVKIYNTQNKEFVKSYNLEPDQKIKYFEENIGKGDGTGLIMTLKIKGDSAIIYKNNNYSFSLSYKSTTPSDRSIFNLKSYKKEITVKKKYEEVHQTFVFEDSDF